MNNSITLTYDGSVIRIDPTFTDSPSLTSYQVNHSLVHTRNPAQSGLIDVYRVQGMQYSFSRGYSPVLTHTRIVRAVIDERTFRPALFKYIQKYVDADEPMILRAIGRDDTDDVVIRRLALLPRKRNYDRVSARVHTVMNFLSRVAHAPITSYLDYGTGDGTVASTIGKTLNAETYGVDVFPMERPIPTLIIKEGEYLPTDWTGKFQLITAFVVFHHVKQQEHTLRELYRVLAPGGILIFREHDYRDLRSADTLLKSTPQEVRTEGHTNSFRHFLDAVHITSMAVSGEELSHAEGTGFWALYRTRYEWHTMLTEVGFSHVCTNMLGINPQMEVKAPACTSSDCPNPWYEQNPQRTYEAIYRKDPEGDTRMIIEYHTTRDRNLSAYFPKIGGATGTMPDIREGVHYNEEILAYMTPWHAARETSQLISRLIREKYEMNRDGTPSTRRVRPFSLYDGTGGAGGNLIAFMGNRDINTINVYERVPDFFRFLANNAQLYSGTTGNRTRDGMMLTHRLGNFDQRIYLHNADFPLNELIVTNRGRTLLTGSVLFLDVPWVLEGCGYKLSGYVYAGVVLEQLVRTVLNAGALMVLLKLPPNYHLGVKHEKHDLGKETLYAIFPWFIREHVESAPPASLGRVDQPIVTANPITENPRSRVQENSTQPRLNVRRQPPITSDVPVQPVVQAVPLLELPLEFNDLVQLIEREYPSLRDEALGTLPFDEEAVESLRNRVRELASQR